MIFTNNSHEVLQIYDLNPTDKDVILNVKKTDMTFIWNTGKKLDMVIDKVPYELEHNQIIFLTEFHRIDEITFESARMVRFNQPFYCIVNHDNEVGSKGLLFFGATEIPIVTISESMLSDFEKSWDIFCSEMKNSDILQQDMLQALLKRFLILSVRILRQNKNFDRIDASQGDIIREFNYLVERHFAEHHDVAFYASQLNKSPKTLSNLFSLISDRAPLNIIHDRIMIHARRQINYSNLSIKEIAYELGYDNIQTFSRFFKAKEGVSPGQYRKKYTELVA
ncbi:helix-turn-helix transcriptional regulator [Sphingobacterium paramultivorum]|uniref:Helix-turn-helix transcriptional regulator n=1 Tax=Sphingobacterium paramultivorum TaxID=2886510 RepID=A0A7G5DZI1_9SPHI|nr:AraC family transcriptional regulator [Sphingobacterium paramultivorum]QMV67156.1 helix-turn-helix transcriptional regulator [Sphingobacterium paramultivorum]WSO16006.1 AraC family transcriptional regulator [Sphingobacterium paramultivorum]